MHVRQRLHLQIAIGHFAEAMKWARELDARGRQLGLAPSRFLIPFGGRFNQLIIEAEWTDFASFEREEAVGRSNPELMELFKQGLEYLVPGELPVNEMEVEPDEDYSL